MIGLAFLNPLLLWALPLAAVPVIIHILNRRRFQKVPWAAMEFLLKAMKRNRKRLRMEQWIVRALRVLAVLLLALLVARPPRPLLRASPRPRAPCRGPATRRSRSTA